MTGVAIGAMLDFISTFAYRSHPVVCNFLEDWVDYIAELKYQMNLAIAFAGTPDVADHPDILVSEGTLPPAVHTDG
jgi:hypothetical protein